MPQCACRDIGRPAAPCKSLEKESRVVDQPAFVLHSYPYKETSLIVDVFSRDYGRVALVAKGAKRPHSKLRGVLQTFQPLSVGWSGKVRGAHLDRRPNGWAACCRWKSRRCCAAFT